jgi:hypothetical protein
MRDTLMLTVPCLGIIVIVYTSYGMDDSCETTDTTTATTHSAAGFRTVVWVLGLPHQALC